MTNKIYDIVKEILETCSTCRDSDKYLYLKVLLKQNLATMYDGILGTKVIISDWNLIPPFESITRARRKLQELYPELRGNTYKQGLRKEKEDTKGTFIYREKMAKINKHNNEK